MVSVCGVSVIIRHVGDVIVTLCTAQVFHQNIWCADICWALTGLTWQSMSSSVRRRYPLGYQLKPDPNNFAEQRAMIFANWEIIDRI